MNKEGNGKINKIKSICFITPEYPVDGDMTNTFVDELICEIARQGIQCTVIAPFDVFRYLRKIGKKRKSHWVRQVNDHISFDVYCPRFLGFTGHKGLANISQSIYNNTVLNQFRKLYKVSHFDAVYGHFFGTGGLSAQLIGKKYNIPSFVACGESSLKKLYQYDNQKRYVRCIKDISGIVCVSTKNKDEIVQTWSKGLGNQDDLLSKMQVFPNGYFPDKFHVMDKSRIRQELGIRNEDFIICFLGRFKEHKGIIELNKALQQLDNVGAIFLGRGDVNPYCKNLIFAGQVDHSLVPKYLNASDVFVLPTRAEGCSNAIVEALACGLPVISSDLPFNYDILDKTNSILVNPYEPSEIVNAIRLLRDDEKKRLELRSGAIETAKRLTINSRASNILDFIEKNSRIAYEN